MNNNCPSFRIILISAAEIYHTQYITHEDLVVKNSKDSFNRKYYKDVLAFNLDLLYLLEYEKKFNIEDGSLKSKTINGEYYTDDFINVSFEYSLKINDKNERVFDNEKTNIPPITPSEMRKALYKDGFILNGNKYVRYKRTASAAKSGTCLFIKERLFKLMYSWSKAGLNEKKDPCLDKLTSYEAYLALSLSSIIGTFELNPYNILFVKDFKRFLKDEEVIKVNYDKNEGLVAVRGKSDVENNIFDGEGLLDVSIFNECGYDKSHLKGMMLLRNRFFKCCAFNTNLQEWFKHNNIASIDQLNGFTYATDIKDIVLVVSESCLKYVKLAKGGFTKENVKRWCDAISNNRVSTFGVVKTDKETRFFDGDMVETTYQLLNTLSLKNKNDPRPLISPYFEYISKIRDIKNTPEYIKLFLQGEANIPDFEESYDEDSEDDNEDSGNDELNYSSYSFKNKICYDMLDLCSNFLKTDVFKNHLFNNITDSFYLKLYDGRILVEGTYATLVGNPLEFLQYIIKKNDRSLLEENGVVSSLGKDEIYCSFFKEENVVGSRAPHMCMSNLLYAHNKKPKDLDKWFNFTRNIVVVDSINNNIQQRLNGCDFDSDSMLLTNNKTIVDATKKNYQKFLVPCTGFEQRSKKLDSNKTLIENIIELDNKIASNKVGMIVNLAQKLNSHYWNNTDKFDNPNKGFNDKELYDKIAILSVLAGAEIDSAKKDFDFSTVKVYNRVKKYAIDNGFDEDPAFFFYISPEGKNKPTASKIKKYMEKRVDSGKPFLSTTMDRLWEYTRKLEKDSENVNTVSFFSLIKKDITSENISGSNYAQIDKAYEGLKRLKKILYEKRRAKKNSKSFEMKKREFNEKIENCYKEIKSGISNVKKARLLIKKIEETKGETPYTHLYVLLYIISTKEKELGYSLTDLFDVDGGIPSLTRTKKSDAKFDLFDKFYYKHSISGKLYRGIQAFKE